MNFHVIVYLHRGKCSVSLLNELEDIRTYLEEEDTFYYSMVYDPNQKTLLVDKGEIRTGTDYQAEIPPYIDPGEKMALTVVYRIEGIALVCAKLYGCRSKRVALGEYGCVWYCVFVCIHFSPKI